MQNIVHQIWLAVFGQCLVHSFIALLMHHVILTMSTGLTNERLMKAGAAAGMYVA